MGIKERKEREREEKRQFILQAAREIMISEGVKQVSIRKIARKMEYSPAIIYHYFRDKDDIINQIMKQGYQEMIKSLDASNSPEDEPLLQLKEGLRTYIASALNNPEEYKYMMLNDSPAILAHTSVLQEGSSAKRQALQMLCGNLKRIYQTVPSGEQEIELRAQVIWTATFGLIIRMMIENDLPEQQKNSLIEQHITMMADGIMQSQSSKGGGAA